MIYNHAGEHNIEVATMSTQISFFQLLLDASFLVQCIMLLLVGLSVISWTLIFQYRKLLKQTNKRAEQFEDAFEGDSLDNLYAKIGRKTPSGLANIFSAGMKDYMDFKSRRLPEQDAPEHIERAMRVAIMRERDALQNNLNWLATIGSVSPYIGLFGTVWGIMHSFIALGGVQQATLAMVAPGIAEALIATAMGLFAAIPAVVAYNRFSNQINRLLSRYQSFGEEVLGVLSKQIYA